jgi:hypothetical protein
LPPGKNPFAVKINNKKNTEPESLSQDNTPSKLHLLYQQKSD